MAKRKKSSRIKKRIGSVRKNKGFFKPGDAQSLEQYIFASAMTGLFTAAGAVVGTVLAKYLLNEVGKTVPLPQSLYGAIKKEAGS